ncbi:Transcription elongation factor spt6 [Sporothrix eucalyptigena]|uniref:Transcription elongation factor spt6 n=1 Tax=Sporothrix eucalyptigena TaxID=1812306 RepID=A0ABP0BLV1_9PEZI
MTQLPYELMHPPHPDDGNPLAGFIEWLKKTPSTTLTTTTVRPGLAELLTHYISLSSTCQDDKPRLIRLKAPLALFLAAVEYNSINKTTGPITQLYIAQAPLGELPHRLQQDVPAPNLVQHAGRGDIYDSSVWLGLEPTYTPWHRDPNPNLFCQLCSSKTVRLTGPKAGERIFRQVQEDLMKTRRSDLHSASSRIRGEEMMQGPERELLHRAVWRDDGENGGRGIMHEAQLDAGDMLFIPKGWWHSVRSVHADGRLNGSVNWWFR